MSGESILTCQCQVPTLEFYRCTRFAGDVAYITIFCDVVSTLLFEFPTVGVFNYVDAAMATMTIIFYFSIVGHTIAKTY